MKGSDKAVLLGVVMAVILGFFFFTVLAPKRDQASQLGKDVSDLKAQIAQEQQVAQYGTEAQSKFPQFYARLVVLGKAVPDNADTASLLVQLSAIAHHTNVKFQGISLSATNTAASAAATAGSGSSSTSTSTSSTGTSGSSTSSGGTSTPPPPSSSSSSASSATATPAASTTPAPATEAGAANLPIGATVGSGNLGVMPYSLSFSGNYFQIADFLQGLDNLIHTRGSTVAANGRLMTIDGFSLSDPAGLGPNPQLKVTVAVTSFVTPSSQGLTAGASPSGPAPVTGQPQTQPASAAVSAP